MKIKRPIIVGIIIVCAIFISFTSINREHGKQTLIQSMAVSSDENKVNQLLETVYKELEKNYGELGLSFSPDERTLTVIVKDQAFITKNQMDIKKQINEILKKIEMDDVKVELKIGL